MLSFYGLRSLNLKHFQLYIMVIAIIDSELFCSPVMISLLWCEAGIEN